jgi:hypothetical protein
MPQQTEGAVAVGPPHESFRPNVVIVHERDRHYETVDAFAKRTFNPLQQSLPEFIVIDEQLINNYLCMFRREYTITVRNTRIRQIQYYIYNDIFYTLTFADSDDRAERIKKFSAAMVSRIRFIPADQ